MVFFFDVDKDGISALGFLAQHANRLNSMGSSLFKYLEGLYEEYGYFCSFNGYVVIKDQEKITRIFDKLRYPEYPEYISGIKVKSIRDLTRGYDSTRIDGKPTLPVSSATQMITFTLVEGCIITLRTSGTEPKVKYYSEMNGNDKKDVQQELKRIVEGFVCACVST